MIDFLVIGSGYGGAAIAARLAPRGRLLLIERGKWWEPGQFPRGIAGLTRNYMSTRNPTGLWAMRLGAGTGNAFASAFGGSSAVNYGITVQPEDDAFEDWPVKASELAPYFDKAREVLHPEPNPIGDELGDKQFLDEIEPGRRYDIENTIDWALCDQCGRCVPGCNRGAKRSLDKSYLPLAMNAGAEMCLETRVTDLAPASGGGWRVELTPTAGGDSRRVTAKQVIIAAGTLGTLDLLQRVRDNVPVGPMFGQRMSMNGDGLAFLYDTRHRLSSHSGAPISTCARIPFTDPDGKRRTLMVMSGRVPAAAMRFTGAALTVIGELIRDRQADVERQQRWFRRMRDLLTVDGKGALSHSFMYKLDGQDSNRGTANLGNGGASIDWADYAEDPLMKFAEQRLGEWARKVGGTVVPNVAKLPGMRSFSVHPLGGCRMGADVGDGVVDDVGRVFRPDGSVYEGLRIADGSVIRTSLGVPPSFTISAIAERIAASIDSGLAS